MTPPRIMTTGRQGNIAELSDVLCVWRAHTGRVELRLWLNGDDPVSGRVGADAQVTVAFVGWLGLLGVLEGLVASGSVCSTGHGLGGQLGARAEPELGEQV